MTEYDINAAVRGQCRGHMKGVRRQLTRMTSPAGSSSTAAGSSTLVPDPTPAEQTTITKLVHQQVTGMLQSYQQYLHSLVAQILSGFQLPPMPTMPMLPIVPPQQGSG